MLPEDDTAREPLRCYYCDEIIQGFARWPWGSPVCESCLTLDDKVYLDHLDYGGGVDGAIEDPRTPDETARALLEMAVDTYKTRMTNPDRCRCDPDAKAHEPDCITGRTPDAGAP